LTQYGAISRIKLNNNFYNTIMSSAPPTLLNNPTLATPIKMPHEAMAYSDKIESRDDVEARLRDQSYIDYFDRFDLERKKYPLFNVKGKLYEVAKPVVNRDTNEIINLFKPINAGNNPNYPGSEAEQFHKALTELGYMPSDFDFEGGEGLLNKISYILKNPKGPGSGTK